MATDWGFIIWRNETRDIQYDTAGNGVVRMQTSIFWILMLNNPQAVQDLDDYQVKTYGTHLDIQPEPEEEEPVIPVHTNLEEIDREMRKAPSRSRK